MGDHPIANQPIAPADHDASELPSASVGSTSLATSLRAAHTATLNDWTAVASTRDSFVRGPRFQGLEIFDRVGGGDSFASGLFYGLLEGLGPARALELGAAHGALAMTTPGDTSMATLAEVERLASGGSARVVR